MNDEAKNVLGPVIRQIRLIRKLTLVDVATEIGTESGNVSRIERGQQGIAEPRLKKIAEVLRVSVSDLYAVAEGRLTVEDVASGKGRHGYEEAEAIPSGQAVAPWSIGDPVPDYEVELPVLNVEASAGDGLLVDDEHVRNRLRFQREWLRKKGVNVADAALIYATGDSMAPYIQAGDLVLIDTSQRNLVDDEVFVIRNGHGELRIKRLQRLYDGRIRLKSDNPAYAPEDLAPGVEVDIVGRFVWRGG